LRLGVFARVLSAWAEKPCLLTVSVASVASELRFAGILRPYHSLTSLRGWALVPPAQHGGFKTLRPTELALDAAVLRQVLSDGGRQRLRYALDDERLFLLERDDGFLTPPRERGPAGTQRPARRLRPARS